jgi:soluble lytic murein transglycosylase-like protein
MPSTQNGRAATQRFISARARSTFPFPLSFLAPLLLGAAPFARAADTVHCQVPDIAPGSGLAAAGQDLTPAKFSLVARYCSGAAAAEAATPAQAPRAAQLELYATGYRSGRLAPETADAPDSSMPSMRPARQGPFPPAPFPSKQSATQRILAMAQTLNAAAERHDIDPLLLHAIAHVESRHNAAAVSPAGARGLMQVMPDTARRFGLRDPQRELMAAPLNVEVSAAYLKTLQARFGNDLPLVLAAYNAGEGAVQRHGNRIPDYPETRDYVAQVLRAYRALREVTVASPDGTAP